MYFNSSSETNFFALRDANTETATSILEFSFMKDNSLSPTSTISLIKLYEDQVEIPKLIQATDNPYLTKNDINEFSYNKEENKLHATAPIRFEAPNSEDYNHTYMQIYSQGKEGYNVTYELKNNDSPDTPTQGSSSYPEIKLTSDVYEERKLAIIGFDFIQIPWLYKDTKTRYATETYVTEQINTFQSKFYIIKATLPANQQQASFKNSIPDYATKIKTHELIMPNTDGNYIFTVSVDAANRVTANWVEVRITETNITLIPLKTSTKDINITLQFEWVAKATG